MSWPDGLSANEARQLIRQQVEEWELSQADVTSDASDVDPCGQVGDPNLPTVHTKDVTYTIAKPLVPLIRTSRRFVLPSTSSSTENVLSNDARTEAAESMGHPSSSSALVGHY